MKRDFIVTEVREFTNGQTGHKFLQINLMFEQKLTVNKSEVISRKYADFICEKTELVKDDVFTFDDSIMDLVKREWKDDDGLVRTSYRIYMK